MYPQANMYRQPTYGVQPAYSPPPVASYYPYQPPPPPPPSIYMLDPVKFREEYRRMLSDLTFNSRQIIQQLSMMAQEFSRYADTVVSCVERHIREVPGPMKLPAFYLLDAISKNVYDPYARHFSRVVTSLFLDTYAMVDDHTRNKMEEMLLTWRTGAPNHKELFGPVNQIAIERGVWGDNGNVSVRRHQRKSRPRHKHVPRQITKSQVLSELEFAIGQKRRNLETNPYDQDSRSKINVLFQLQKMITDVGVSQEELRQILNQLRELTKTVPSPSHPPPPPAPAYPPAPVRSQPPVPHYPANTPQYPYPAPVPTPPQQSNPIPNMDNINNLLTTLVNAGIVSNATSSRPPEAPQATSQGNPDAGATSGPATSEDSFREYRKSVLAQKSLFTSSEILRTKPRLTSLLYDRLPSQCKQCGLRFASSVHGKKELEQHLDMHFRKNQKAGENPGRGRSRASFVEINDWIHASSSSNDKGKGRADLSLTKTGVTIQNDTELRSQFVVVPPGDEAKYVSCPICKESLKSEFLEDDEEWVWKNAVMKDDKIYHATCHAEALSSTSSLAARLRSDLAGSSRGATPDVVPNPRSTPPRVRKSASPSPESKLLGVKRKAEDDDSSLSETVSRTPPLKKVALSTPSNALNGAS